MQMIYTASAGSLVRFGDFYVRFSGGWRRISDLATDTIRGFSIINMYDGTKLVARFYPGTEVRYRWRTPND